MYRWFTSAAIFFSPVVAFAVAANAPSQTRNNITLLQPLEVSLTSFLFGSSIASGGDALFVYITKSLFWMQNVAVGIVILWLVFSGIMIMISGNDQGKRTQAKEHAVAAIIGLLMLFLFGFILSMLNAAFFKQ